MIKSEQNPAFSKNPYVMGFQRKNGSLKSHGNAQGCTTRHGRVLRRENSENGLGIVALARPEILKIRAR